jgi:hypothetical protein
MIANLGTKWSRARSLGEGSTKKSHLLGDHTFPSDRTLRSQEYIPEKGMEVSLFFVAMQFLPAYKFTAKRSQ